MIAWFRKRRAKKRSEPAQGEYHARSRSQVAYRVAGIIAGSASAPHMPNMFVGEKSGMHVLLLNGAWRGRINLVRECIERGDNVNAKDDDGRMALSLAAEGGHVDVVEELIKYGAAVNAKDNGGRAALLHAAANGYVEVVQVLATHGAEVDLKDSDDRTALSHAAEAGHLDVVQELVTKNNADVHAKDSTGRGALFYAVRYGHHQVVTEILWKCASETSDDPSVPHALFIAAALGDGALVKELIKMGYSVEATIQGGRTALFFAAQCGQTEVVQILLDSGASVSVKSRSRHQGRQGDTALTLAGRAGHMETFRKLIQAGAPVNVRDSEGETPLLSAARWDFFAGVQLLIAHGGRLREIDVPEGEDSLIPATLKTMNQLCAVAFEFDSLCLRVMERCQRLCSQLQEKDEEQIQEGAVTSFISILFRFCRLLLDITKLRNLRSRLISSRALSSRIHAFHEELDHFADMLGIASNGDKWSETWQNDQVSHRLRFKELLMSEEVLLEGCNSAIQKREAAMLLQYELKTRDERRMKLHDDTTKMALSLILHLASIEAPTVPDWFTSRDDVEFYSWNLVKSDGCTNIYQGKWQQTHVVIETSNLAIDAFSVTAAKWFQLSHPNVVKLFGACNIGTSFVFVYELVPEGRPLHEFLRDDANRVSLWKRLYEAALGLQYLHNRDVIHGDIRSESIIVGSDHVAKWNGVRENHSLTSVDGRSRLAWMAPELIQSLLDHPVKTAPADIYAFGMCVWEALALEIPWNGHSDHDIFSRVSEGMLPERPASIQPAQWGLITRMCSADPDERPTIAYVVNRLKQFVLDHEQSVELVIQVFSSGSSSTEEQHQSVAEHTFEELGDTIPSALRLVQSKCEKLSDEDQWMARSVYPALHYIFTVLQERHAVPTDVEVVKFCAVLSRFQRYLRTAVSKKSVFQLIRSRRVAESNHVIYSELDRLLDMMDVAETDAIRVWRGGYESASGEAEESNYDSESMASALHPSSNSSGSSEAVSVIYFPSPAATTHGFWTRDGLAASKTSPSWTLPLQDLEFNECDQIGQGAFGAVFKGTWLDTPVVIKFMGYEEDIDTISTDFLLHEVRVWHRLNHPHVLKLFGANHINKRYFVCEFASNGDLTKFLKRPGNEHLIWQKMHEAALGLQYLHNQNIAHNDLKCDNIMVGMDGNAKLIDFGLSCLLNEAEIQIDVKKMGAVHWRSPEYLTGGRPSCASDVYSFAMCLIEAVSGDIPWGKSILPPVVRFRVKRGDRPRLPDSLNEKQRNLIQLMTKSEPSERVKISFVADKLNEIAQDENAKRAP